MIKYLATAHYANVDITYTSHRLGAIVDFLSKYENIHQDVVNADTDEVLYIVNNPSGENYIKNEFLNILIEWAVSL